VNFYLQEKIISEIEELKKLNEKIKLIEKKSKNEMKAEYIKAGSAIIIVIISSVFTIFYNIQQNKLREIEIDKKTILQNYQNELKKIEIDKNASISEHQNKIREQENKLVEMQVLEEFIPHLEGETESKKQAALIVISQFANTKVALDLRKIYDTPGTRAGAETIMQKTIPPSQETLPSTVVTKADTSNKAKYGWAYVGDYSKGKWETWYFDFGENAISPNDLVDSEVSVREKTGALNVREAMPNLLGQFSKVIDVLEPGSKVHILKVKEWHSSGYRWAQISYVQK
jgi:hypothetical protein